MSPALSQQAHEPGCHPPLASIDEITTYLRVSKNTVYQWSSRGGGPRLIKVGRHLRARWTDLDRWLDEQTVNAA